MVVSLTSETVENRENFIAICTLQLFWDFAGCLVELLDSEERSICFGTGVTDKLTHGIATAVGIVCGSHDITSGLF